MSDNSKGEERMKRSDVSDGSKQLVGSKRSDEHMGQICDRLNGSEG